MDQTPEKRVGDGDRSQALDKLGHYFADGYLDIHEFEDRTGKAAVARTQAEIDGLFADLPDQVVINNAAAGTDAAPELRAERELDEVMQRGRKIQRLDGAIWAIVLILFFLGTFVASVSFSWVVFPIGAFASWGVRSFLDVGDEDEKLFEELKKKEREQRAGRLRQAAERRHELGH